MTLRAEIAQEIRHLFHVDQMKILSIIDSYTRTGEKRKKTRARDYTKTCMSDAKRRLARDSRVIYVYQAGYDTYRVRISERLFDPSKEVFVGRYTIEHNLTDLREELTKRCKIK